MKKVMKKKWIVLALVLTIVAVGAVSLTAFGADNQRVDYQSQMQKKQPICTVNQDCFKKRRSSCKAEPCLTSDFNGEHVCGFYSKYLCSSSLWNLSVS